MEDKNIKKAAQDEIKSTLRYMRAFVVFGIIIAVIAILFFTLK